MNFDLSLSKARECMLYMVQTILATNTGQSISLRVIKKGFLHHNIAQSRARHTSQKAPKSSPHLSRVTQLVVVSLKSQEFLAITKAWPVPLI